MLYACERTQNFKYISKGIVLKHFRVELVYILLFIMAIIHKCTLVLPYMKHGKNPESGYKCTYSATIKPIPMISDSELLTRKIPG